MSLPSVLVRKSTGEIIKHDLYPREDMQPVEGLDPDLEWLLKYEPFVRPDYDSRLFILQQNEEITETPHPDYAHLNQYLITFATLKRDVEEIQAHIENAETNANQSVLPYEKQLKIITLGLGVLFRKVEGMSLNAKEQVIADRVESIAVKLWKNDQTLRDKVEQLANGEEPNLDEGWEKDQ